MRLRMRSNASPKATALTDAHALHAIRLIETNLPLVVEDGANVDARMEMLQASLMGITAFSFALSAIPVHNFAHAYGVLFRIPHGLANAVFLLSHYGICAQFISA